MLAKAAKVASVYDELETAELTAFMRAHPAAFDLVVSADTLGLLRRCSSEPCSAPRRRALRPGGHLVFTVEQAPDDPPERLPPQPARPLQPRREATCGACWRRPGLEVVAHAAGAFAHGERRAGRGAGGHGPTGRLQRLQRLKVK